VSGAKAMGEGMSDLEKENKALGDKETTDD
jgi:hypothetical protein